MELVNNINQILTIFVSVAYSYQILYFLVALWCIGKIRINTHRLKKSGHYIEKNKDYSKQEVRKFAFVIAARNEECVITKLIESIRLQNYPKKFVDIFLVADNCTDKTALVAKNAGAIVYERFNKKQIGKGYAMEFLFDNIEKDYGYSSYDGFFVFDSDNLLDKNYINEMNAIFHPTKKHHRIVTGYRNSKNFDTNWISSGYSIAFLREARYLNYPRSILSSSSTVSGTGYLVSSQILIENGGWHFHLLTEDIQLSTQYIARGERIAFANDAVFYDEQPTSLIQSWHQRMRWNRGFYQVIFKYGKDLLKNMFKDKKMFLSRYDMFMFLAPSIFFNIAAISLSVLAICINIIDFNAAMEMLPHSMFAIFQGILTYYLVNFSQAFLTVVSEWDNIVAPNNKKIVYMFTYPLFMFTYIPISIFALFTPVKWKPIKHTFSTSLDELKSKKDS